MTHEGKGLDIVYWAKTSPSSYWPARPCTQIELKEWANIELGPGKNFKSKKGHLRVTFFGSYDHQHLPLTSLLPYEENLMKFKNKNKTVRFKLALEEAQAALLQKEQKRNYNAACVVCGSSKGDPNFILVCDRCQRDVHLACLNLSEIPEGDFYCPNCERDAPLTMKFAKVAREKKESLNGKRKRSRTIRNYDTKGVDSEESKSLNDEEFVKPIPAKRARNNRKKPKRKRQSFSSGSNSRQEDTCFLCKRTGDGHTQGMVMCDFPNCNKMYHIYCLGHLSPDIPNDNSIELISEIMKNTSSKSRPGKIIQNNSKKWFCPWHYCAITGEQEHEKYNSLSVNLPSIKVIETYTIDMARSDEANRRLEIAKSSQDKFIRCIECPFTLCSEERNSTRPVYDESNGTARLPEQVTRTIHPHNVFHCLNCNGHTTAYLDNEDLLLEALPHIQFSKFLYKVWSIMLNDNHLMFQPFLFIPDDNILTKNITDTSIKSKLIDMCNTYDDNSVKCMVDIKDKILALKYSTLSEFEQDIETVLKFINNCYISFCPNIIDASNTFKNLLVQRIAAQKKKFAVRKLETAISTLEVKGFKLKNASLNHLFPSMKRMEKISQLFSKKRYRGPLESWTKKLGSEIVVKNSAKTKVAKKIKKVDSLVRAFKVLTKQPKQANLSIEHATSPTIIMDRLNEQEYVAKQLLDGYRQLKKNIQDNHRVVNDLKYNNKTICLEDLGLVAEFRLANKNLRTQIEHLKIQISLEKQRRIEAETQVDKLKELLKH